MTISDTFILEESLVVLAQDCGLSWSEEAKLNRFAQCVFELGVTSERQNFIFLLRDPNTTKEQLLEMLYAEARNE